MAERDCAFILEPVAQSETTNPNSMPSLNYTNQDFSSIMTRTVGFIQERFPNDFSDFIESDLGIMLIEILAFIGDGLSFKQDQIVNEIFIDTVTEVENAFRIARAVGFQPTPPIGARALFSATVPSILPTDLSIESGIALEVPSGGQTITFELFQADALNNPIFDQPIIITAGSLSNTSIVGVEGSTRIDTFSSTGNPAQVFQTSFISVLFDSVRVDVDGNRWERIEFFTDSQARNEYRVEFDSEYRAFIMFGNGKAGRVPSVGSVINVTYRVGGGTIGNIVTGFIVAQRGFELPGFNFVVPVTFTNYTKGEFGYAGDTIDDIRQKLPAFVKVQDRAVTGEDYKTLTDQFASPFNGQIGKSTAVLRNSGCAGNIVDLYILARDGVNGLAEANDQLKLELTEYLNTKKMLNHFLCLRDGVVVSVDIIADVIIDKFFRKFQTDIQTRILNRISDFFSLNNWDYGKNLKDTELIKSLSDITEITDVSISFVTNDPNNSGSIVVAQYFEIIRNDNVNLNLVFE